MLIIVCCLHHVTVFYTQQHRPSIWHHYPPIVGLKWNLAAAGWVLGHKSLDIPGKIKDQNIYFRFTDSATMRLLPVAALSHIWKKKSYLQCLVAANLYPDIPFHCIGMSIELKRSLFVTCQRLSSGALSLLQSRKSLPSLILLARLTCASLVKIKATLVSIVYTQFDDKHRLQSNTYCSL